VPARAARRAVWVRVHVWRAPGSVSDGAVRNAVPNTRLDSGHRAALGALAGWWLRLRLRGFSPVGSARDFAFPTRDALGRDGRCLDTLIANGQASSKNAGDEYNRKH
jgi:hypothetical protein